MARNPWLRAADADRDRTAAQLREHHAQGRLTLEEFQERLTAAFAAKTYGELDALLADLPADDLNLLPMPAGQRRPPARRTRAQVLRRRVLLTTGWSLWAFVSGLNLVIWLVAGLVVGDVLYPWWVWVAGPWGAVMLAGQLATRRPR